MTKKEGASLEAHMVKNLLAIQESWVQSLHWEDPLKKEMATYSSILTWRIPWTEETGRLQSTGSQELDTTQHQHQSTQMIILSLFTRGFPGSSDG